MNNPIKHFLKLRNKRVIYFQIIIITTIYFIMELFPKKIEKYVFLSKNIYKENRKISFILNNYTHQDFDHYFGNIILLIVISFVIDNIITSKNYLITFIVSGILSNLIPYFKYPNSVLIGSSGSIYGLLGYKLSDLIINKQVDITGFQILILFLSDFYGFIKEDCNNNEDCTLHSSHLSGGVFGFVYYILVKKIKF